MKKKMVEKITAVKLQDLPELVSFKRVIIQAGKESIVFKTDGCSVSIVKKSGFGCFREPQIKELGYFLNTFTEVTTTHNKGEFLLTCEDGSKDPLEVIIMWFNFR
ncbi:hypothetical protein A2442_01895 [Candidatus Campbellbacteria bacterium RIFOXYC2_FULL_35_25]|uniref:Uncharacterized protein n=1 Tax=Candidatus Campbellbacteria bacterium RIFOXYC2_FULL_35_25 TaxID=1797582 RepID=A0A1F5EI71_9BACT|nr:MAG: hypothetical protein A2442_01895 [Candidatus Campbellbacteria bacterium RIFOXYC2_FULL_35_25]